MLRPRIRHVVLALAGMLTLAAAGCGGSQPQAPVRTLASLEGVADRSTKADTARFEMLMRMTLPGVEDELELSASGAFDRLVNRAQLSIDMSGFVQLLGAAFGGAGADLGDPADWKLEAVQDKTVVYLKLPAVAKDKLPAGKSWIRADAAQLGKAGAGLGDLGSVAGGDPRDVLEILKAAAGDLEPLGREDVRGVSTSRYRASLDLAKLTELAVPKEAAGFGNIDQLLEQTGLSTVPLEVWVDDDDLVRRMDISLAATAPGNQGEMKLSLRIELYDYGTPLFIELPPAGEVADLAALSPGSS